MKHSLRHIHQLSVAQSINVNCVLIGYFKFYMCTGLLVVWSPLTTGVYAYLLVWFNIRHIASLGVKMCWTATLQSGSLAPFISKGTNYVVVIFQYESRLLRDIYTPVTFSSNMACHHIPAETKEYRKEIPCWNCLLRKPTTWPLSTVRQTPQAADTSGKLFLLGIYCCSTWDDIEVSFYIISGWTAAYLQ